MISSSHIPPVELRDFTYTPLGCPRCGGPVDVRTRYIEVRGSAIRMYCSEACQKRDVEGVVPESDLQTSRGRRAKAFVLPSILAGGLAAFGLWMGLGDSKDDGADGHESVLAEPMGPPRPSADEMLTDHGPAWPPTEEDRVKMLADDAWIHPLKGPERRMPIRASRAFGAHRPGHRPDECKSGHCGVDLGGEQWGEPVLAVQDGVVERVERDRNGNGGRYVWLSHRDGTVFTHYFHLAAIPPEIEPGTKVRRGQTIGLLGASGVKHSGPHLHFTVAVKLPGDKNRQYIDPEPLIALWPVEVPLSCDESATRVSTTELPGRVVGSQSRPARRPARRIAKRDDGGERGSTRVAAADDGADDDAGDDDQLQPVTQLPSLRNGGDDRKGDDGAEGGTLPAFTP